MSAALLRRWPGDIERGIRNMQSQGEIAARLAAATLPAAGACWLP
ncbi:hypothetical protein J2W56_000487 [Nocardia kruczakiae]|uniref:Uncharacterized protein n=1 Tax=Nocardia kruczakiae TaxID=261477 RepID=A0ABU1X8A0_9NOCA|nr:hypothetical protein [Nocardia kruczakiae]MDR7166769.1 hypothetical protein [Nocardia kruczakiae]